MKKYKFLIISLLVSLISLANAAGTNTNDQTPSAVQNSNSNSTESKKAIQSKNAGGEIQTITIDDSGNLKVIDNAQAKKETKTTTSPAEPVNKTEASTAANTVQPTTTIQLPASISPTSPLPSAKNPNTLEQNKTAP